MAVHPLPQDPRSRGPFPGADEDAGQDANGSTGGAAWERSGPHGPGRDGTEPAGSPDEPSPGRGGRRRRWWIEVLAVVTGYEIYETTRGQAPTHHVLAQHNGHDIWRLEQWLHLDPEPWLNHAITGLPAFAALAGYYYLALNFTVPIGVLVWLYRTHPEAYGRLRWILATMTGVSLFCFWLYPVSPPRFVVPHMVDTVATSHLIGAAYQDQVAPHANLYAAMPSLHVAWAGWCTLAVLTTCSRRWLRGVFLAYPVVTTADIVVTANHYLADALGGALLLAGSYAVVVYGPRLRRRRTKHPVSIRKR